MACPVMVFIMMFVVYCAMRIDGYEGGKLLFCLVCIGGGCVLEEFCMRCCDLWLVDWGGYWE